MIPGWKVKRELARFAQQLRAIPEAVWEPFAQRSHDAALRRGFPVTEGMVPAQRKVAIVLCWQPNGLAESVFLLLDHLVASGYAPFVITNAPVSEADRQKLQQRIWRSMERPNFGYDFGGYRDGLLMLRRWGVRPEHLVIVNDSIWFPLWDDDRTLERAEAAPFDVTGIFLRQRGVNAFLESYFFSIKGTLLDHPSFCAFWDGLRLTSNKYKVIRRGERGFGLALKAAGVSFGPLFPKAEFEAKLAGLDAPSLRQVLAHLAAVAPGEAAEGAALARAPDTPEWEPSARAFIARVLVKSQAYSAFPVVAAGFLRYPVLKKSMEPVSARWRAAFLRAVDDGIFPPPFPAVLAEARARTGESGGIAPAAAIASFLSL